MAQAYENKELEDFIEGQWIKIQDNGEGRTLEFIPEKTQVIEKKDFNGNMAKKVQFIVIDPKSESNTEKKFEVSRKHAAKIYEHLKKGKTILELYRSGEGIKTDYIIKAVQ
jgi:23S rRNA pseudoU1915 N3-methylase RlmH